MARTLVRRRTKCVLLLAIDIADRLADSMFAHTVPFVAIAYVWFHTCAVIAVATNWYAQVATCYRSSVAAMARTRIGRQALAIRARGLADRLTITVFPHSVSHATRFFCTMCGVVLERYTFERIPKILLQKLWFDGGIACFTSFL